MIEHYYSPRPPRGKLRLILDSVAGIQLKLYTSSGVFSSSRIDPGTRLLLEHLVVPPEGAVLDLGAGIGVIGIFVAKANPRLTIYMSDVNRRALELARLNARANNVEERVRVVESDVYDGLRGLRFAAVYSNPPLSAGWRVVERMILEAPGVLEDEGFMQAVFARGERRAIELGSRVFESVEVLKRKSGYAVLLFRRPSR
ncbi:MAG: methyltransferase [Fervidicoccaceae archaeon]